ncbi:uncharacterized protein EV422DRAFT_496571 [Fimicolochytrium jonesii]|uniref:uncharacterized protein n=1 Tax=Fimicolochytrium jonesii TaxID=1396493 RepID=UPI0022FE6BE9|nr:uncharacterized protein EV422DRAFT_496571 [Fimicolochytrium jonesii]KAI8820749.1 hypothetical protein EV422DRAFT_496571 [Fimicolochytrium jonesii]
MTLAHRKPSWGEGESSDKEKENKLVRRLTRQRSEKEVLVGTPVKEGHTNFVLMYDMLMGIRVSVSRCQAKPPRSLFREDFSASHKMTFDVAGSEVTPSSRYDFKFKDYAPWVFRCIRDAFNVDPAEYLLSVTGKYILSELGSPGKSGSFFYYSSDYRYIIKTIKRAEKKAFMRIIHWYYEHCRINQNTTLCRILGLHRVKLKGHRKLHFIVMLNVFPGNKDIHEMYDLKGSTVGREFPEELAKDDPRAVLKDINWMNRGRKLELGPKKAQLLTEQLEKDVKFLADHNIMDYSLLVGIHDMKRGNTENIRDKTLGVYEPNPDAALAKQFTAASLMMSRPGATNPGAGPSLASGSTSAASIGASAPRSRAACVFYADNGGFQASDENDQPLDTLYYLGTIDIFTTYDYVKKIEHFWKSFSQDAHMISAVPPPEYGQRFLKFMKGIIRKASNSQSENTSSDPPDRVQHLDAAPVSAGTPGSPGGPSSA